MKLSELFYIYHQCSKEI